jgi:hypothetical protein
MMFEFTTIKGIIDSFSWILTLGKSELVHVKSETNEVISELSKSLRSLWDVTKEIANLSEVDLTKEQFEDRWDYFFSFYVGDQNISAARTHCGNVMRDVERIKFKLAKILHTDIGRWRDVDKALISIIEEDPVILENYDACIASLENRMSEIRGHFDAGDVVLARQSYATLKQDIEDDIRQLREGIVTMEQAIDHVNRISG